MFDRKWILCYRHVHSGKLIWVHWQTVAIFKLLYWLGISISINSECVKIMTTKCLIKIIERKSRSWIKEYNHILAHAVMTNCHGIFLFCYSPTKRILWIIIVSDSVHTAMLPMARYKSFKLYPALCGYIASIHHTLLQLYQFDSENWPTSITLYHSSAVAFTSCRLMLSV